MQTTAKNNLFLTTLSSLKRFSELRKSNSNGEFYQQVLLGLTKAVYEKQTLNELGNKLSIIADQAYSWRQMDMVEQASQLLISLPLSERYRNIGQYHLALCMGRRRQIAPARILLERVIEEAPPQLKSRATLSLGGAYFDSGDYKSAAALYTDASRAAADSKVFDPFTFIQAGRMIAVLKSIDGDNHGALADLEQMLPIIHFARSTYPQTYFDYLNSLAVELGEAGRIEEALHASRIAVASPYSPAYPEWRETQAELLDKCRRLSRSTVTVSQAASTTQNVVSLPAPQQSIDGFTTYQAATPQQARVLRFKDYMKLAKEVNGAPDSRAVLEAPARSEAARLEDLKRMTTRQKLLRIMDMMSDDRITDEQLLKILLILEGFAQEQLQNA